MSENEIIVSEKERIAQLLERRKGFKPIVFSLKDFDSICQRPLIKAILEVFPKDLRSVRLGNFFDDLYDVQVSGSSKTRSLFKLAHGITISKKDLLRYLDQSLAFWGDEYTPNRLVSWYDILYRLPLIMACEKDLKYQPSRIRQIIEFDDHRLHLVSKRKIGVLRGKPLRLSADLFGSPPVFIRKYYEWLFDYRELLGLQTVRQSSSRPATEIPPNHINPLEDLANFDYDKASTKEREFLRRLGIVLWYQHERWRLRNLAYFHEPIYRGYSPQVRFQHYNQIGNYWLEPSGEIDWSTTLCYTDLEKELSFFRTPEFEVELNEGKITIQVFNPPKADSNVMGYISKIYNIFRQRLRPRRKGWGVVTKRRKTIYLAHIFIREQTNKLMKEDPDISLYDALDSVGEQVEKKFDIKYSLDTLRRKKFTKPGYENGSTSSDNYKNK